MVEGLYYNLKILRNRNLYIALALPILAPLFFSFRMITPMEMAKICELYLSFFGIVLFGNILDYESNGIGEVTYCKKFGQAKVFMARFIMLSFIALIVVSSILALGKVGGGTFEFGIFLYGTMVNITYLGIFTITIYNISENLAITYMISFSYILFEYCTKGKYTKNFYILSMTKGDFAPKDNLFFLLVVLVIVNIFILYKKR